MKVQNSVEPSLTPVGRAFQALCELMAALRSERGCEWDREQDLHSLRPYLLEEAHEVLEVLDALNPDGSGTPAQVAAHRKELGDLMLQIVFQAQIQRESGRFDAGDVCDAIREKLIRRHPHIFDENGAIRPDRESQERPDWEATKRAEREADGEPTSALAGVPKELPALLRALRVGQKAHRIGFDWPSYHGVLAKIREEIDEVEEALEAGDRAHAADEVGDLLYAVVNLCRHVDADPEASLRRTISRFERRFMRVEQTLREEGKTPEACDLEELEAHWERAKKALSES